MGFYHFLLLLMRSFRTIWATNRYIGTHFQRISYCWHPVWKSKFWNYSLLSFLSSFSVGQQEILTMSLAMLATQMKIQTYIQYSFSDFHLFLMISVSLHIITTNIFRSLWNITKRIWIILLRWLETIVLPKTLSNIAGCPLLGCASHRYNFCVKDFISNEQTVIEKVHSVMKRLKHPTSAAKRLLHTHLVSKCNYLTRSSATAGIFSCYQEIKEFIPKL